MMLRILFFFVLTIINNIETATNVGGILFENTVWTADGSENPYNLVGDVQIPFNSTLTIRPGVVINFGSDDCEILVKGFLRVEGTVGNPVIFQGGYTDDEQWMIKFQSTQLSLSSISYAHFIGPKKAVQLASIPNDIQKNNGTLIIQSSIFSDNTGIGTNGVYNRSLNPFFAALKFESCIFNQTVISSISASSEPITINNSQIYDSKLYPRAVIEGVQINNCNLTNIVISFKESTSTSVLQLFKTNAKGISIITELENEDDMMEAIGCSYQFIVRQSTIQDFKLTHYTRADLSTSPTNITFEESAITNISVTSPGDYGYTGEHVYTVIIRDSVYSIGSLNFNYFQLPMLVLIESCRVNNVSIIQGTQNVGYDVNVLKLLVIRNSTFIDGSIAYQNGSTEISYSTITLATPPLSLGRSSIITCSSISRSDSIPQVNTVGISAIGLTLDRSTIQNFAIGIYTYPTYNSTINIIDTNFIGNSMYTIENKSIYNVNTQGVYWGTNDSSVVIQQIKDYWKDINYGFVQQSASASNMLIIGTLCSASTEDDATTGTFM